MSKTTRFTWWVALAASLAGCADVGHTTAFNEPLQDGGNATSQDQKVTVAVTPFVAKLGVADSDGSRHRFEEFYFAARLASTLKRSTWVRDAYFSPTSTPAVDYVLTGEILQSDGEHTRVHVMIMDNSGRSIWNGESSIELGWNDWSHQSDPGSNIWNHPANEFGHYLQGRSVSDRIMIQDARWHAYAPANQVLDARDEEIIEKAASIERDGLLAPITKVAQAQAKALMPMYSDWQRGSTRDSQERRAFEEEKMLDTLQATMSVMQAGLSSSMEQRGQGISGASDFYQQQALAAGNAASNAQQQASIRVTSIDQLNEAVANSLGPISVEFEGQLVALKGNLASQESQFREFIRQKIIARHKQ